MKQRLGLLFVAALTPAAAHGQEVGSWRIDGFASRSSLGRELKDWTAEGVVAAYRPSQVLWLSGGLERSQRFGFRDTLISGRVSTVLPDGSSVYATAAFGPQAHVRAQEAIGGGGVTRSLVEIAPGWKVALGIDLSAADYRVDRVATVQPFLQVTSSTGAAVMIRGIETVGTFGRPLSGYAAQVEGPIGKRVRVRGGYALAPETDTGKTMRVRATTAGLSIDLRDRVVLRFDVTHEQRPSFDRDEFALGLAYRF